VLSAFVLFSAKAWAFSYRPEASLRIYSEYKSPHEWAPVRSRVWKMEPQIASDGDYLLHFSQESHQSESSPLCTVRIHVDSGDIEWQGIGGKRRKTGHGLLIHPGFPAPCDILPVEEQDHTETYEERREAGGRTFVRTFSVSYMDVSREEARESGWLGEGDGEPEALQMITVVDKKDRVVVKQLWPLGGTWWIYEETPFRRSWIIQ
jgi:hypothetical protein